MDYDFLAKPIGLIVDRSRLYCRQAAQKLDEFKEHHVRPRWERDRNVDHVAGPLHALARDPAVPNEIRIFCRKLRRAMRLLRVDPVEIGRVEVRCAHRHIVVTDLAKVDATPCAVAAGRVQAGSDRLKIRLLRKGKASAQSRAQHLMAIGRGITRLQAHIEAQGGIAHALNGSLVFEDIAWSYSVSCRACNFGKVVCDCKKRDKEIAPTRERTLPKPFVVEKVVYSEETFRRTYDGGTVPAWDILTPGLPAERRSEQKIVRETIYPPAPAVHYDCFACNDTGYSPCPSCGGRMVIVHHVKPGLRYAISRRRTSSHDEPAVVAYVAKRVKAPPPAWINVSPDGAEAKTWETKTDRSADYYSVQLSGTRLGAKAAFVLPGGTLSFEAGLDPFARPLAADPRMLSMSVLEVLMFLGFSKPLIRGLISDTVSDAMLEGLFGSARRKGTRWLLWSTLGILGALAATLFVTELFAQDPYRR